MTGDPGFKKHIFLYGPPGSGKSSLGRILAEKLMLPFIDLDRRIEQQAGMTIEDIFAQEGEPSFRLREKSGLQEVSQQSPGVIALGGGALLDAECRALADRCGQVVCLSAPVHMLQERMSQDDHVRPLLAGQPERLQALVDARAAHYASFPLHIDTMSYSLAQAAWQTQVLLGRFYVQGMGAGYAVTVQESSLEDAGEWLSARNIHGPIAVVCDDHIRSLYAERVQASLEISGYKVTVISRPSGEQAKEINQVASLWDRFVQLGLERQSAVLALGGGVISDLAGFAAATYLRGINWVVMPTSLLGMVDAAIGGKTGIDLPAGKNLAGTFHPPQLVLADPACLDTLPPVEISCGLAEVVKAAVIADPDLFELCSRGWSEVLLKRREMICRAIAVKVQVIEADPFEQNVRAALNLGHTLAHAIERLTNYTVKHGQAVAIGLVLESRLAEIMGIAERGLSNRISVALDSLGLPTRIPDGLPGEALIRAMDVDKKKKDGRVRFSLPCSIGEVKTGILVEEKIIWSLF